MTKVQSHCMRFMLCIIGVFFMAAPAASQQTLWVVSKKASLKAEMKASSKTITTLAKGAKLSVVTKKGRWYKVSTASNQSGWIYRGKVSTTKPKDTGSGGLFGNLSGSSDIRVSSADTDRSVRGLSPEAEIYANNTETPAKYRQALDKVLDTKTSDTEIEQFLKAGNIGEYAQ